MYAATNKRPFLCWGIGTALDGDCSSVIIGHSGKAFRCSGQKEGDCEGI
jgi:hypothetical protein